MADICCPLTRTSGKNPDSPAIITHEKIISFGQLEILVHQAATNLKRAGVGRTTTVAVTGPNSAEMYIIILAALRIGAVICPLNHKWPVKAIKNALHQINCDIIICSDNDSFDSNGITKLEKEKVASLDTNVSIFRAQPIIHTESPAVIIFSSGSTSEPKAALLSYDNLYQNALGANKEIKFKRGDKWLLSLPLYHVGGIGILFRSIIEGGAVVIPHQSENIAASIEEYGLTHLSLVPTQLFRLLESNQLNLVNYHPTVLVGGAPATTELLDRAKKAGLKVYTTYGLTEMGSQVTTGKYGKKLHCGKALRNRKVKIAPDGEILVKGKTLFLGYVGDATITLPLDKKGWFHTGDVGKLDSRGKLTVQGRQDNMFISGGENIYPEEIESCLKSVAGIDDALVVAVEDKEFGRRPSAFVKFSNGRKLSGDKIISSLEKDLPRFKIPRLYFDWPDKSYSESLKPNRQKLQKLAADLNGGAKKKYL